MRDDDEKLKTPGGLGGGRNSRNLASGTRGSVRRARLHAQNRGEPALGLAQSLLVLGLREPPHVPRSAATGRCMSKAPRRPTTIPKTPLVDALDALRL